MNLKTNQQWSSQLPAKAKKKLEKQIKNTKARTVKNLKAFRIVDGLLCIDWESIYELRNNYMCVVDKFGPIDNEEVDSPDLSDEENDCLRQYRGVCRDIDTMIIKSRKSINPNNIITRVKYV